MMDGCLENGRDISLGGVYNNYGFHGTGLATAADSLAAVKKYVFETGEVGKEELWTPWPTTLRGHDRLLHLLRYTAPKMGNNETLPDSIACELLESFAEAVKGKKNEEGALSAQAPAPPCIICGIPEIGRHARRTWGRGRAFPATILPACSSTARGLFPSSNPLPAPAWSTPSTAGRLP